MPLTVVLRILLTIVMVFALTFGLVVASTFGNRLLAGNSPSLGAAVYLGAVLYGALGSYVLIETWKGEVK